MKILGLSCYYHDSAAALIVDGNIVAAAEEERFSRKKHDAGFPRYAIEFCLDAGGIKSSDLDCVVFYEKPFKKFDRLLASIFETYPRSFGLFKEAMIVWGKEKLWIKNTIADNLDIPREKVYFVEHHLSHASSAFLCSPFEDAAIMTIDGAGEWATGTLGTGQRGKEVNIFCEQHFPHSIGLLYSVFTAFLGFEVNEGEYKVMGMAPYGEPLYVDKIKEIVSLEPDGSFRMDMDYFSYHYHTSRAFTKKFEALFGPPRRPGSRFVTEKTSIYDDKIPPGKEEIKQNQYYADIAASIQKVTEEILINTARYLYKKTSLKNLCIGGGVGLNCVANRRMLEETDFENIFIQPAAGDSGGAIGAALYYYNCISGADRCGSFTNPYLGRGYSNEEIKDFLTGSHDGWDIKYSFIEGDEELVSLGADAIMSGKVVGWFQGRFEWGPRALGNRSILADARRPDMKDIVNIKIKFREPYRPFAPSVLEEDVADYFNLVKGLQPPLSFMLMTLDVKDDKKSVIPAVTHVDGSARVQAVNHKTNPLYYKLIKEFKRRTGVPVILNTSFNLRGEPIVNTPANACKTFMSSGMDVLFLGNYMVEKK